MLAKDLITDEIPPLKTSDSGQKALDWMEEFKVSHLPIVNKSDFLGLISEDDILSLNNAQEALGNHALSLQKPFVKDNQHIYDVFHLMHDLKLTVVPVLSESGTYEGLITAPHLLQKMAESASITDPGSVLILEVNQHDYSLSQIARLVEDNDAMILSSNITSKADSTAMEVTLKINKMDLTRIIASFNRYNYVVKASYHQSEYTDNVKEHYNALMNYLNI